MCTKELRMIINKERRKEVELAGRRPKTMNDLLRRLIRSYGILECIGCGAIAEFHNEEIRQSLFFTLH